MMMVVTLKKLLKLKRKYRIADVIAIFEI